MNDRSTLFLQEMGMGPRWMLRDAGAAVSTIELTETVISVETVDVMETGARIDTAHQPSAQQIAALSWPELQESISACRRCPRGEMRRHAIPGSGDMKAKWLVIAAAPDNDASHDAAPLSGASLALFGNMLRAIDLAPDSNVYLTTTVKCRATDDRAPNTDEISACRPYLERQIALLQPTILIAFGGAAAATLLQRDLATPLADLRGPLQQRGGVPVVATHPPQHLIDHPADKREAWADLCLARETDAARP